MNESQPFSLDAELGPGVTLLEASAGTGKTYSIAALCLRLVLEQGLSISELLVVTFTNAATAELRSRIRERFAGAARVLAMPASSPTPDDPVLARLVAQPDMRARFSARAQRALAEFDTAAIYTIHGFCQRILQDGAFETGAELDAELAAEQRERVDELSLDYMHKLSAQAPSWAYALATDVAGINTENCTKLVKMLLADPDVSFDGVVGPMPEFAGSELEAHLEAARTAWPQDEAVLRAYATKANFDARKLNKVRSSCEQRLQALAAFLGSEPDASSPDAQQLQAAFDFFGRRGFDAAKKGKAGPEPQGLRLPDLLQRLSDAVRPSCWGHAAYALRAQIEAQDGSRDQLSFDDLLHNLAFALDDEARRPALVQMVRGRYKAALVDEFQDTDRWQWRIFGALFDAPTHALYLIGDPKQSIYSFRGADIATYLNAKERASTHFRLDTNWRSDGGLLQTLNHLYAANPRISAGIEYSSVKVAAPNVSPGLRDPKGAALPAMCVLRFPVDPKRAASESPPRVAGALEAVVAADVAALLKRGLEIRDDEQWRPLSPRDLAVLVDTNPQAEKLQAQLRARGVPTVQNKLGSVFATHHADWLALMCQAWLSPRRAPLLRALLISPLGGYGAPNLSALDDKLFDLELSAHLEFAQLWAHKGIASAWRAFCAHSDLARRLASQGDGIGARAWTNYQHLVELLHDAQVQLRLGPVGLTRWLASRQAEKTDADETKLRLDRDDAALTLVTVHRSKGLEYPIVYYPYAGGKSQARSRWQADPFVISEAQEWKIDFPVGAPGPEPRASQRAQRVTDAQELKDDEAARRLYVALTRAKHQLRVCWGKAGLAGTLKAPLTSLLVGRDTARQLNTTKPAAPIRAQALEAAIDDAFARVSDADGSRLALIPASSLDLQTRWEPTPASPPKLEVRPFTRPGLDRLWRRASYTSLVHGATYAVLEGSPEAEGRELHPTTSAPAQSPQPVREDGPLLLADFVRGAEAGTFLHAFYEHVDFKRVDDEAHVDKILDAQMQAHGIASRWHEDLSAGLCASLRHPLGGALGDICLADVPRADRIDELGFELPIAGGYESDSSQARVRGRQFGATVARHRSPTPNFPDKVVERWSQMNFSAPARGFLTGSIDLLFRAPAQAVTPDGSTETRVQYFIADYKSNWLGEADRVRTHAAHYAPVHLVEAMLAHDYHLQYHLYVLAAHRYLRARLGAAYDYERDFGGVRYLFVRGMSADRPARTAQGEPHGVFCDRPEFACIDALDRLFAQGSAPPNSPEPTNRTVSEDTHA